jgi:imidazolonepropionase-like amidohydrolase
MGIAGGVIQTIEDRPCVAPDYDLSRFTLLPGLIDSHVHIGGYFDARGPEGYGGRPSEWSYVAANAARTLFAGFTTVQSVGSPLDGAIADSIEAGRAIGPRVLSSLGAFQEADASPERMRAYVRRQVRAGADVVKIYASKSSRDGGGQTLSVAAIRAACIEARALGIPVWVHAHAASAVRAAAEAGCTTVAHGSQATDVELKIMAAHGTYFEPNLGLVIQAYFENKERWQGRGNFTEDGFLQMEVAQAMSVEVFRRALRYPALRVLMGSDATAGGHGDNAREITFRVHEGGQAALEAIKAATSLNAEALGLAEEVGALIPGLRADVIAVDGNPLQDIEALRRVVFVMRGGTVYKDLTRGRGGG